MKLPFFTLLLLTSFASIGATLFTPALPAIQAYFGLSASETQGTVTWYLLGYAIGQLLYAPLANRFGRKPALYLGLSLALVGSLFCALSYHVHSFTLLVGGRVVQALGACAGLKISFTMIGDVLNQRDATRMISRTLMVFAILPGLATSLGGWLTQELNWPSCFYFLTLYGLFALGLVTRMPETARSIDPDALHPFAILRGYHQKLKSRRLLLSALMMGCGTAVIYLFAAKAPFIGIQAIGMSPEAFGLWNLIPSMGIIIGSLIAPKLGEKLSLRATLLIGILICSVMTLAMLIPFSLDLLSPWTLFLPMVFIYVGEAIIYSNVSSYGLSSAVNKSNASATMHCLNLSLAFVTTLIASFNEPLLLPVAFLCLFFVMFLLWIPLKKSGAL